MAKQEVTTDRVNDAVWDVVEALRQLDQNATVTIKSATKVTIVGHFQNGQS